MEDLTSAETLELEEDLRFQQGEWHAARVLWVVLILLMAATALGLFGNGPLSRARAQAPAGGLWVEYPRFARFGTSERFEVHTRPGPDGLARVSMSRSLLDRLLVVHITPRPRSATVTAEGVEYQFDVQPAPDTPIVFEVQSSRAWVARGRIRSGRDAVQIEELIYP